MTSHPVDPAIAEAVAGLLAGLARQLTELKEWTDAARTVLKAECIADVHGSLDEAGKRLTNAHLLRDDIQDWASEDETGLVAMQAETIIMALTIADAEYQRAVDELKGR